MEDDASSAMDEDGPAGPRVLPFQTTSRDGPEFRTWFRGEHTNFNPNVAQMVEADAALHHVLHGWAPSAPRIGPETQITAFGSCFAANISRWLSARKYSVNAPKGPKQAYVVTMGEGMVNSFVIRQQFEWAWEGRVFEQPLWHGYRAEAYGYDEDVRLETRRIFDSTDVFILTFGLSEVWYDEPTGNVFWRTVPKDAYDPRRHRFRVSSVEENRDNIRAILDLIRRHRPDATVILTLSPIPLIATFRDVSCLTANSVSKSVLRVAIDEALRELRGDGLNFYWPSYELVTDVFRLPFRPDRRHPPAAVLDFIMTLFEHVWCASDEAVKPSLAEAWVKAQAVAGNLPSDLLRITNHRKIAGIDRFLARERLDRNDDVDAAMRRLLEALRAEWVAAGHA